jgi:hypothetical protein
MRIQMESTEMIVTINGGVKTRIWNAVTEDGVQCFAFVACLGFRADQPLIEVEKELLEVASPLLDEAHIRVKV